MRTHVRSSIYTLYSSAIRLKTRNTPRTTPQNKDTLQLTIYTIGAIPNSKQTVAESDWEH